MPGDVCFKETDDKSMSYLDLEALFKYGCSFLQDLQSPKESISASVS